MLPDTQVTEVPDEEEMLFPQSFVPSGLGSGSGRGRAKAPSDKEYEEIKKMMIRRSGIEEDR